MYADKYSDTLVKILAKLKKKAPVRYNELRGTMDWILENSNHRYKFLHHDMKGVNRVHLGHFVLTFIIDHINKVVSFEDYDHHDNVYGKR